MQTVAMPTALPQAEKHRAQHGAANCQRSKQQKHGFVAPQCMRHVAEKYLYKPHIHTIRYEGRRKFIRKKVYRHSDNGTVLNTRRKATGDKALFFAPIANSCKAGRKS